MHNNPIVDSMAGLFASIRKGITSVLAMIVTFVYNLIFSKFVSIWAYEAMGHILENRIKSFRSILDVGVGTGLPLSKVLPNFPKDVKVLGIDIDKLYVQQTQKLFKNNPNVEIKEQNFYTLTTDEKYDLIILGFSFMLMPSPEKALLKAKELLAENGRIVFLLTMHKKKNKLMQIIKPAIKYLTTIDFGKMTYEEQFLGLLDTFNLRIMNSERLGENLFSKQMLFRFCNVWVFETAVARQ